MDRFESVRQSVSLDLNVVASLEVKPESLGGLEVPREPQGRVCADPSLAGHDLVESWDLLEISPSSVS